MHSGTFFPRYLSAKCRCIGHRSGLNNTFNRRHGRSGPFLDPPVDPTLSNILSAIGRRKQGHGSYDWLAMARERVKLSRLV